MPRARSVRCLDSGGGCGGAGRGQVVEAEADGVGFGVDWVSTVMQGQQAEPGAKIDREVGGEHPACVDLP